MRFYICFFFNQEKLKSCVKLLDDFFKGYLFLIVINKDLWEVQKIKQVKICICMLCIKVVLKMGNNYIFYDLVKFMIKKDIF